MKLTDEQLKKLLQEQAETEQSPLTMADIEAYTLLFESLDKEKATASQEPYLGLADDVMAEIILIQDKKDRRADAIHLALGIFSGLLALTVFYYLVDLPQLKAALLWLKAYLPIIVFVTIAVCAIQFADRKWVWKR
ncbi:hypothetical protein [Parapedobacter koreensis]|uniref:Uncharacterized protein n=1 Tax=Parapedobacter koreensis TaxID=332977 RepID=A0A1H7SJG1_9SPHI|nr:hypothetical protein [Parapedobacter koreensis]SEL72598.1 hypothetical protein SAMN05421740_10913 [Parapedobacter koreensis]